MKIVINSNTKFQKFANIFQHAKDINDLFSITMSEEGMFMQGFDKCRVCIMEFLLKREWFDEFSFQDGTDMPNFGIYPKVFYKILNTKEDGQEMTVQYNGDDDHINISFTKGGKKEYNKHFKMTLIEVTHELLDIPDEEDQVEFTIEQNRFSGIVDQLMMFHDNLEMKINNDFVYMKTDGDEGTMKIEIDTDDLEEFSAEECEADTYLVEQNFALKYIKTMCMFNRVSNLISIRISDNRPICCYYSLENESYLRFYLAPKE